MGLFLYVNNRIEGDYVIDVEVSLEIENMGIKTPSSLDENKEYGINRSSMNREKEECLELEKIKESLEEECKLDRFLTYSPTDRNLHYLIYKHGGFQILGRPNLDEIWEKGRLNFDSIDEKPNEIEKKFINHIREDFEKILIELAKESIDGAWHESIKANFSSELKDGYISSEFRRLLEFYSILEDEENNQLKTTEWQSDTYKLIGKNGLVKCFIFDSSTRIEICYLGNFKYDDFFEIDFLKGVYRYDGDINLEDDDIRNPLNYFGVLEEQTAEDRDDRVIGLAFSPDDDDLNISINMETKKTKIYFNASNFYELKDGAQWIEKIEKIFKINKWVKRTQKLAEKGELERANEILASIKEFLNGYEHPKVIYTEGIISLKEDKYKKAIKLFEDSDEKTERSFVKPLNKKAEALIALGEYQKAKNSLEKSLDRVTYQPEIREDKLKKVNNLIDIKHALKRYSGMIGGLDSRAQKILDKNIKNHYEEGKNQIKEGRLKKTRKFIKKIENCYHDDTSPEALCLEGLIFLQEGKFNEATDRLKKADDSSDPIFVEPLIKLAAVDIENFDYDSAVEKLKEAKDYLEMAKEVKKKTDIRVKRNIDDKLDEVEEKLTEVQEKLN